MCRRLVVFVNPFHARHVREFVESKTRVYRGRVGTGRRTAGRWIGAGQGGAGRRRDGSPRKQPSFLPPTRSKKIIQGVFLEARTKETLRKPRGEQNPRLTVGVSMVYPWRIRKTTAARRFWLLTNVPSPNCLCNCLGKPSSCKACPGMGEHDNRLTRG